MGHPREGTRQSVCERLNDVCQEDKASQIAGSDAFRIAGSDCAFVAHALHYPSPHANSFVIGTAVINTHSSDCASLC